MKRILVPTDFSEESTFALKAAAQLAKKAAAKVYLLYVKSTPSFTEPGDFVMQNLRQEQSIESAAKEALNKTYLEDVHIEFIVKENDVFGSIKTFIEKESVDFVVIGKHTDKKLEDFLAGEITDQLIENCDIPILVIKEDPKDFVIKNALFASNFLEESYEVFKKAKPVLSLFSPKLHLLKVITSKNFEPSWYTQKLIGDFINECKPGFVTINTYNESGVFEGISKVSEDLLPDMIIMETHGRKGWQKFLHGSLAKDMIHHLMLPMLFFHIPESEKPEGVLFPGDGLLQKKN